MFAHTTLSPGSGPRSPSRERRRRQTYSHCREASSVCAPADPDLGNVLGVPKDLDHWFLADVATKSFRDTFVVYRDFHNNYKDQPAIYHERLTYLHILTSTCVLFIDEEVKKSGNTRESCWRRIRNSDNHRIEISQGAKHVLDSSFDKSYWYTNTNNDANSAKEDQASQTEQQACAMDVDRDDGSSSCQQGA